MLYTRSLRKRAATSRIRERNTKTAPIATNQIPDVGATAIAAVLEGPSATIVKDTVPGVSRRRFANSVNCTPHNGPTGDRPFARRRVGTRGILGPHGQTG
jgi:hypothetical protein